MIPVTDALLPERQVIPAAAAAHTPAGGPYHLLVEQAFLGHEELALATAEARRKRVDIGSVLLITIGSPRRPLAQPWLVFIAARFSAPMSEPSWSGNS